MELQVRGNDIPISDNLRDFALRRAEKLDRIIDRVVDAKLELRKHHQRAGGDVTVAQLTIQTGRNLLRAEERDHDPKRAIDLVIDTMDKQVRRFHDKRTDRKGRRPAEIMTDGRPADLGVETDLDEGEERPVVVRTKRFSVKPMNPEEAIDQMELLGHDFFLFHNAEESQLNVVYRRRDGTYGLLSPDRS